MVRSICYGLCAVAQLVACKPANAKLGTITTTTPRIKVLTAKRQQNSGNNHENGHSLHKNALQNNRSDDDNDEDVNNRRSDIEAHRGPQQQKQ